MARDLKNLRFPPSFFEDEVRDGFFVSNMMKHFWAAQLQVLAEIDRICRETGIPWFIDSGTLLGAARHKGYIPWDDDLDIIMFREDLDRFVKEAQSRMRPGFRVNDIRSDSSYLNTCIRIQNSEQVDTGMERMEQFFGCPYIAGVDIFALDGLYEDAKKEAERRGRWTDALIAAGYVSQGKCDTQECMALINKIERQNHMVFDPALDLHLQILLLQIRIAREVPARCAKTIGNFFEINGYYAFPMECYLDTVMMEFEGVLLPAPRNHEYVLQTYYGDYHKAVRGQGAHIYPVWARQERLLEKETGHHPFRYTMTKEDVTSMRKSHVTERINTLTRLLQKSRDLLKLAVEKSDLKNTQILEEKCRELTSDLHEMIEGREDVVFIVCRAAWWGAMEDIYDRIVSKGNHRVYVLVVPWFEKSLDSSPGTRHDESELFSGKLPIVTPDTYRLEKRMPAAVYTSFPYDDTNREIGIDPEWHSRRLRECTEYLTYIPCHRTDEPKEDDNALQYMLRVLVEQPAVAFSDCVIVESEKIRSFYVETLTQITNKEMKSLWEQRIQTV